MRSLGIFLLAACGWAAAQQQAAVIQGYASTLATGPFLPLVNTPEVSLDQPSLSIGASNATAGLVAGASSATGFTYQDQNQPQLAGNAAGEMDAEENSSGFDAGGLNQPETGVARLMGPRKTPSQPVRMFTNDDVDKLNQQTGTVKYGDKNEELH